MTVVCTLYRSIQLPEYQSMQKGPDVLDTLLNGVRT